MEDASQLGAYKITVALSTGLEVKVYVLPSDTAAKVKRKVEAVHGRQPDVAVRGRLVRPPLCAKWQGKWQYMNEESTMDDIDRQAKLKFADISDKIRDVKLFSHAHWAASNAVAIALAD